MTHNDPVEAPSSHSPGPAASETPHDAREVERRERWAIAFTEGAEGYVDLHPYDKRVVNELIDLADREQAAAVGERDRLRAGIEALAESWRYKGEFGWGAWQEGQGPSPDGEVLNGAAGELRALFATPDADGQGEPSGCECTELCEMGPTCPGGMLADLPGSGCWRADVQDEAPHA